MRKISYLLVASLIVLASCKPNFKKADDGSEYQIISSGKGDLVKPGEFLELHFTSILTRKGKADSIMQNTREMGAPQIVPFDSLQIPPNFYKLFKEMKSGDSVCTRTLVDTLMKKNPDQIPPFMKKGDYIYFNIKIMNAYKTKEQADSARTIANANAEKVGKEKAEALVKADDKTIADYIAKNKITATKNAKGVYIETLQAGTGAVLDTTSIIKVKYTGKTLAGVMFDSNVDPSKGHTDPLTVNLTNDKSIGNGVIPGFESAMYGLQKGSKVKIYIPSGLAYGARGAGADIPANANLIFEIEVLDILTLAQFKADNEAAIAKGKIAQAAQQKEMMAAQKKYEDSLQKADPKKYEEYKQQMMQQMQQQMQQQGGGRPQR